MKTQIGRLVVGFSVVLLSMTLSGSDCGKQPKPLCENLSGGFCSEPLRDCLHGGDFYDVDAVCTENNAKGEPGYHCCVPSSCQVAEGFCTPKNEVQGKTTCASFGYDPGDGTCHDKTQLCCVERLSCDQVLGGFCTYPDRDCQHGGSFHDVNATCSQNDANGEPGYHCCEPTWCVEDKGSLCFPESSSCQVSGREDLDYFCKDEGYHCCSLTCGEVYKGICLDIPVTNPYFSCEENGMWSTEASCGDPTKLCCQDIYGLSQ